MRESLFSNPMHYMRHIKSLWQIRLSSFLICSLNIQDKISRLPDPTELPLTRAELRRPCPGAALCSPVRPSLPSLRCFPTSSSSFVLTGRGWACSDEHNKAAAGRTGETEAGQSGNPGQTGVARWGRGREARVSSGILFASCYFKFSPLKDNWWVSLLQFVYLLEFTAVAWASYR